MRKNKRIIIKIGSSSLVLENGKLNQKNFETIISMIKKLNDKDKDVVLVTSGAIAVGMGKLGFNKKPKNMALKQACAAIGQVSLMNEYQKYADDCGLLTAQILVNHDDFENRNRMINLSNTFIELFNNKILPIVNENDALNVEEIKVGDNDTLSALIASMINADMLILASDIDGLYDKNPKQYPDAVKINYVSKIDESIDAMIGDITSNVGTGGMETKIKAARIATNSGCDMAIISSNDLDKVDRLLDGENIGTIFTANKILHSKEHWIVYNTYAKGTLIVDDGAKKALLARKSLLPKGITEVNGDFNKNSVVFIKDQMNETIGKGIVNYSSNEISKVLGKHTIDAMNILTDTKEEVVHANSLVILNGENYGKIK